MPSKIQSVQAKLKGFAEKCDKVHLSLERVIAALLASLMFSYIYVLIGNGDFSNYQEYYLNINFGMFFTIALITFGVMVIST